MTDLVRKPASANNGGELDNDNAQTIAGDKTYTGTQTFSQPINAVPAANTTNLIINGNFDFWQRGTSSTGSGTEYLADRFAYKSATTTGTLTRETDAPNANSTYSFKVERPASVSDSAVQDSTITYHVEGGDFQPMAGKQMTLSFWVKALTPGTYCVSFQNSAQDRSYVSEYTIASADTWEYQTITLTHNTTGTWLYDNNIGLSINWQASVGSDFETVTTDSWIAGNFLSTANAINAFTVNNGYVQIAQVMMHQGEQALPAFQRAGRNIGDELSMCQRYYWQIDFQEKEYYGIPMHYRTTTTPRGGIWLPTSMRVVPTFSTSGSFGDVQIGTSSYGVSAIEQNGGQSFNHISFSCTTTARSAGDIAVYEPNADTIFKADAEL